jgi:hypothetical protein
MIPGILTPSGNLGALTAHQVVVQPIADAAVTVGDLVKFDLDDAGAGGYADIAFIDDADNKKNPFNVVKLAVAGSSATTEKGGIWGVALEAAAAGARCKVCIAGVVTAKVTGAVTAGVTPLIAGAGVLTLAPVSPSLNSSPALGLALETQASGTGVLRRVLISGLAFCTPGV